MQSFLSRCHSYILECGCSKKAKGNISLLVILVLLSSSLITLLSISQLRNLTAYGSTAYNYFRAHYLAKAWLEHALTAVSIRDAGFSTSVTSGNSIVTENFQSPELSGFMPYFDNEIQGRFKLLTNDVRRNTECLDNEIKLETGESMVIPLFVDNTAESHSRYLSDWGTITSLGSPKNIKMTTNSDEYLIFWLFSFSGDSLLDMADMITATGTNVYSFLNSDNIIVKNILDSLSKNKTYLTIVNPTENLVSFCIESSSEEIPSADTLIKVSAHYGGTEVWFQAIFKEPFPNFLQGSTTFSLE